MTLIDAAQSIFAVLLVGWVGYVSRRLSEPARAIKRSRAQWLELELEVANVLEKLGTWANRQAKRDSRAAQAALADQRAAEPIANLAPAADLPTGTGPGSSSNRKADLWRRARDRAAGRIPDTHSSETRFHSHIEPSSDGGNGGANQ